VTFDQKNIKQLRCFCQRADALGAQYHLNLTAILDDRHLLQVGTIGPIGVPLGEGYIIAKCCGLATVSALCHF
jgi:hypothetical protein